LAKAAFFVLQELKKRRKETAERTGEKNRYKQPAEDNVGIGRKRGKRK